MSRSCSTFLVLCALGLSASFSSCSKKTEPTPNPIDTTGIDSSLSCRPTEEFNVTANRLRHRYTYDTQGRVIRFTNSVRGTSGSYTDIPVTVTYDGDAIILTDSDPSTTNKVNKYQTSGGKIVYRASGPSLVSLPDTARYYYTGEHLVKFVANAHYSGSLTITTDSIVYANGLPVVIHVTDRDGNGQMIGRYRLRYAYDTRQVSYSPYNVFSVAPGIEPMKVDRMLTQSSLIELHGSSTDSTGTTYTTSYDSNNGNAAQVEARTVIGGTLQTSTYKFTYVCQ